MALDADEPRPGEEPEETFVGEIEMPVAPDHSRSLAEMAENIDRAREQQEAEEAEEAELRTHQLREARADQQAGRPAAQEPHGHVPLPARPPLPNGVGDFAHGTIEKAVKAIRRHDSDGDVRRASRGKLPPADVARVRRMAGPRAELLRLNPAGKLDVDERVPRKGARIVLRYLDESGTRWLDPKREL